VFLKSVKENQKLKTEKKETYISKQTNNKKEKKYEELKKSNPFVLFIFESIDYIIPFSSNFCNFSD
jgi:hypothetical protein